MIIIKINTKNNPYIITFWKKMQLYLKKEKNYILKQKPWFLNFIKLSIQVGKKKSQRSRCCLNTLWFHFTLLISGWSLKSNSKRKWKYFTQKIESICSSIWKPIGKKTWVFKNWILTIGSWCGFFPPLSMKIWVILRGNEIDLYQV